MASYPTSLPNADAAAGGLNHGQVYDELYAGLSTLGTNPQGGATDVKTRLLNVAQNDAGPMGPYTTGRYYDGSLNGNTAGLGGVSLSTNQIRFSQFYCSATTTFDRIGVLVTVLAAASSAHLGIWTADTTTKLPATIIEDQVVSVAATGGVEATISRTLTGDTLYWLGIVSNGTPSVQRIDKAGMFHKGHGTLASTDVDAIYATFTYGTLTNNPTAAYFPFTPPSIRLRAA